MIIESTRIKSSEDQQVVMTQEKPAVPFYIQHQQATQFRFYLSEEIEDPEKFHQMCQVLRQATDRDQVFIHLNSIGGRIDSTIQVIAAIRECKGEVITVADGVVASAATLLFLAGDGYIVNPHCLFMVHNFSGGAYGKGHELESQVQADIRWFTRIATDYYEGFLTDREIKKMFKGEDFWFTADEVMTRIEQRVSHMRSKQAAAQATDTKTSLSDVGNHLKIYLDDKQQKQVDRLISCAIKNMESNSENSVGK